MRSRPTLRSTTATRAGPSLDAAGQVVGVNSQIQSASGGSDGVGFAIPSNTVSAVVSQLVAGDRRPRLSRGPRAGLVLAARRRARAGAEGHAGGGSGPEGPVTSSRDSTARAIDGEAALAAAIDAKAPGARMTVTYIRRGKTTRSRSRSRPDPPEDDLPGQADRRNDRPRGSRRRRCGFAADQLTSSTGGPFTRPLTTPFGRGIEGSGLGGGALGGRGFGGGLGPGIGGGALRGRRPLHGRGLRRRRVRLGGDLSRAGAAALRADLLKRRDARRRRRSARASRSTGSWRRWSPRRKRGWRQQSPTAS